MLEQLVGEWGLWAIFLLMMLNGSVSCPPSEIVLPLAGALAAHTSVTLLEVFLVAITGNLLGTYTLYFVGKKIGYTWLLKIRNRLGNSRLSLFQRLIPREDILSALVRRFKYRGYKWVFIFRCLPVLRSIISIPAGISKMPHRIFFTYSLIGIICWAGIWVSLGFILTDSISQGTIVISIITTLCLVGLCIYLSKKLRNLVASIKTADTPINSSIEQDN